MKLPSQKKLQKEVDEFNQKYKVGDPILYYSIIAQSEPPVVTRVRTTARILGGHTAVVWLEDVSGCVACSHCFSAPAEYFRDNRD
jgi:hypothetical protein